MSLENIVHKTARPLALFGAGIYLLINTACGSPATPNPANTPSPTPKPSPTQTYNPTPTNTPEPTYTPNPTPTKEPIPTITPTPTLEAKLFEFIFPDGTDEQRETFSRNALEDYRTVLKVYGIKKEDARIKIWLEKNESYSIGFYYKDKEGGNAWVGFDSFTTSRNKFRHETAHAINHTLFKTKIMLDLSIIDTEPWYNTFDEGSAMYASGEIESAKPTSTILREDDGSLKDYNWMKAIDYLISTPNKFWDRVDPPDNAGWLTGQVLYLLLEHEGLTPEKNAVAIKKLTEYYMEPSTRTNKEMIQSAYESALGKSLNHLFDTWLEPGIKRFYVTSTSPPR